jgi:hypothetical protein
MRKNYIKGLTILFSVSALAFLLCGYMASPIKDTSHHWSRGDSVRFEFQHVTGIGVEPGVSRRDPSDIIRFRDHYYIWYTKIPAVTNGKPTPLYNSGYYGTIWYATSVDGTAWIEQGKALGPGEAGAFDSHAVFTPNILQYEDKFYLYYTGVKPTPGNPHNAFDNNAETDITGIGVAVADMPEGPFRRVSHEAVIEVSSVEKDFDSYRVDDAALLVKNKKIWLYYKGRSRSYKEKGPAYTRMGVALADKPEGPFTKHTHPILDKSHEVLVWNQDDGIASLTSINRALYFAADGLNFSLIQEKLMSIPHAPGLYRPHLTDHSIRQVPGWGISHAVKNGDVYLVKYTMR